LLFATHVLQGEQGREEEHLLACMTAAIEIDGTRFGNAQVTNLSGQTLFLSSVKLTYYHGSRRLRKISIVFACLEQKNFVQTTSLSDLLLPVWTGASETQVVTVQAMLDEIKDKLKTSTIKLISLKALSSPPEAALARPAAQLRKQKEAATDNAVIKGVQAELKKENKKTQAALVALENTVASLQAALDRSRSRTRSRSRSRSRSPSPHQGHRYVHRSHTVHEHHHHHRSRRSGSRSNSRSRSRSGSRSPCHHRHGRRH
jgi:hypothetical protein